MSIREIPSEQMEEECHVFMRINSRQKRQKRDIWQKWVNKFRDERGLKENIEEEGKTYQDVIKKMDPLPR